MGFRALGIRVQALGHRGFREWGSHGFEIISGVGIGVSDRSDSNRNWRSGWLTASWTLGVRDYLNPQR